MAMGPSLTFTEAAAASNETIARRLREMAALLKEQGADGFRPEAYLRAARVIDKLETPLVEIHAREGFDGLVALPAIGRGIAAAIAEIVTVGHWSQLDRLKGASAPTQVLRTLPGVGPCLAKRIHEELHIDTLEQLEMAAHDGRLERLAGFGPRRAAALRAQLAARLGRRGRLRDAGARKPPVDLILDIDRDYRRAAAKGDLPLIAPRRFNPAGRAWLPVWHPRRGEWHFSVLFSNTERAHKLGKTHDWVVIYAQTGDSGEMQCTVVTETRGPLAGKRVIRGREIECATHYESTAHPVQ
jgi:putative hydrolase